MARDHEVWGASSFEGRSPGFFDAIRLLPWAAQLASAALILAMAVVAVVWFPSGGALLMLVVSLVCGLPLAASGLSLRRTQQLYSAERSRAEGEMVALRRALEEAEARGGATHLTLSQRGYSSAKVRRWIARECGVVLPERRR